MCLMSRFGNSQEGFGGGRGTTVSLKQFLWFNYHMTCIASPFYVLTLLWGWWHPARDRADPRSVLAPLACPVITLPESPLGPQLPMLPAGGWCRCSRMPAVPLSWGPGPHDLLPTCSSSLLRADLPPCPAGLSMTILSCPAPLPFSSSSVHQHNHDSVFTAHPGLTTSQHLRGTQCSSGSTDSCDGFYHFPLYSFVITASRPFKHKLDHIPALNKTHWDYS